MTHAEEAVEAVKRFLQHVPSVFERQKGTGLGRTPYSLFCASHMGYVHGDFMGFPGIDGG